MKIIDISWPITPDVTEYRDESSVSFVSTHSLIKDKVRRSRLMLGSQIGTHVNSPACLLQSGKTIDQIPLEQLTGLSVVLDLTHVHDVITREDLEQYNLSKGLIVLLKTPNSELLENAPFESEFVYLDQEAADYCVEIGIKAIGIDYLCIERTNVGFEAYNTLYTNNIAIIEGLRFAHVAQGTYFFICLPLAVIGLEAAPARAILVEDIL